MAPEALSGKAAFRADMWSLSVTLYELVTGRLPFPLPPGNVAQGVEAIKAAILQEDPIPPNKHNPKIGERLNGTTMRSRTLSAVLALFAALPIGAQLIPRDSEFHVKLLAPIDTKTSRKGDKITAQVLAPAAFRGDILGGRIDEASNGGKLKGKAVLHFTFQSLNHRGRAIPVQSSVKSVTNSKGKQNVDEEGQSSARRTIWAKPP
jgi:serine/threonine protein kinase